MKESVALMNNNIIAKIFSRRKFRQQLATDAEGGFKESQTYLTSLVHNIVLISAHLIVSFLVFYSFVGYNLIELEGSPTAFMNMVNGTAPRPFVYRTLLPSTVRFLADATPPSTRETTVHFLREKSLFPKYFRGQYAMEYAIVLPLVFLCFLGTSIVLRLLAQHFYPGNARYHNTTSLGGMLILPLFFVNYGHYIYDPPTIFLFSLATLLIAGRHTVLFFILLPFLVVQKETSILLIPLYAVFEYRRRNLSQLLWIVVAMGAVWLAIKVFVINEAFHANAGSTAEFHLLDHNLVFYRYPLPVVYALCVVGAAAIVVSHQWKQKDILLRLGLTTVMTPLVALMIVFAYIDELRDLYEAFPLLVLLMVPTISEALDPPKDCHRRVKTNSTND